MDVNDNLFGTANDLFIEDAISETQVITSGASAEFGRFSGGVINAITKSGGDEFSGSFRVNLTNDAWTDETPFERTEGIERPSIVNDEYEATLGGPLVRGRLWFFTAGRWSETTDPDPFPQTPAGHADQRESPRRSEAHGHRVGQPDVPGELPGEPDGPNAPVVHVQYRPGHGCES